MDYKPYTCVLRFQPGQYTLLHLSQRYVRLVPWQCWFKRPPVVGILEHKRRKQQRPPKQGKCAPPSQEHVCRAHTQESAQIANKKDDQHTRCSAKMPMTYLVKAVKNKLGALKGAKA